MPVALIIASHLHWGAEVRTQQPHAYHPHFRKIFQDHALCLPKMSQCPQIYMCVCVPLLPSPHPTTTHHTIFPRTPKIPTIRHVTEYVTSVCVYVTSLSLSRLLTEHTALFFIFFYIFLNLIQSFWDDLSTKINAL